MKHPDTPIGIALFSLAICLAVGVFVIAIEPAVLQNLARVSILVAVTFLVPVTNFFLIRHRQSRSNG